MMFDTEFWSEETREGQAGARNRARFEARKRHVEAELSEHIRARKKLAAEAQQKGLAE